MREGRRDLVNAVSAKMGGAANYVEALAGALARSGTRHRWTFVVPPPLDPVVRSLFPEARVVPTHQGSEAGLRRLAFDQWGLRRIIEAGGVDTLFSTGNVALLACPCRQLLLVRNALFFSVLYKERIQPEKGLRTRAGERARRAATIASIRAADVVLTPSHAMRAEMLAEVPEAGPKTVVNLYGVDAARFRSRRSDETALTRGPWRLLFPSLYAEHKNVGTLLRALQSLQARGTKCILETPADPRREAGRTAQAKREATLAEDLRVKGLVCFTGDVPRSEMPARYSAADLVIYPSVVESFGHPLVESMAAGLPIVAADVPINREICEEAAIYFPPFDEGGCATAIESVLLDVELRSSLSNRARERAELFSWGRHVAFLDRLVACAGAGV